MKPVFSLTLAGLLLLALSACAAGSADSHHAAMGGDLPQFVLGFWHGIIAPVTLIIEIINRLVPHLLPWTAHLYEKDGTGTAYDVGFYLGLAGGPPIILTGWRRRRL
jgi:hypothetical protein